MNENGNRMIFVNLPVRDLERSKAFFARLGFAFDPRFTDDKAACMVVNDQAKVMLLQEEFFRTFTTHALCDTGTHTEGIFALSCSSREEVDALMEEVVAAGGSDTGHTADHGFMVERSFYDPDGHHWEVVWMDPRAVEVGPAEFVARGAES